MFLTGTTCLTILSIAAGFLREKIALIVFRALIGLSKLQIWPRRFTILSNLTLPRRRGINNPFGSRINHLFLPWSKATGGSDRWLWRLWDNWQWYVLSSSMHFLSLIVSSLWPYNWSSLDRICFLALDHLAYSFRVCSYYAWSILINSSRSIQQRLFKGIEGLWENKKDRYRRYFSFNMCDAFLVLRALPKLKNVF